MPSTVLDRGGSYDDSCFQRHHAGRRDTGLPWIAFGIASLIAAGRSAPLSPPSENAAFVVEKTVDTRVKEASLKAEAPADDPHDFSYLLNIDFHPQGGTGQISPEAEGPATQLAATNASPASCSSAYQEGFAAGVSYQSRFGLGLAPKAPAPAPARPGRGDMALPLTGAGSILVIGALIFLCSPRCRRD